MIFAHSFLPLPFKSVWWDAFFCMLFGYIINIGSWFRFKRLLFGDPLPFVIVSTVGNIISLSGACFLSGPRAQTRKMFHETRRIASVVYLSCMLITLLVAFLCTGFKWQAPLMIILMITQYVAVTWYCLSYIPFARDAVKKAFLRWWRQILDE